MQPPAMATLQVELMLPGRHSPSSKPIHWHSVGKCITYTHRGQQRRQHRRIRSRVAAGSQPVCAASEAVQLPGAAAGVKRPRITVLGGGVIGLSAATVIAEAYPGACVTVAAERFLTETTSHGAGGLWKPYAMGADQDPELISRWGGTTFQHFSRLHASADAVPAGCFATSGYTLWTGDEHEYPEPTWRDVVPHFHRLSAAELAGFAQPYAGGWSFSTMICEGGRYLPWLTARFQRASHTAGGRLVVARIGSRPHLEAALFSREGAWRRARLDCDLLVNCTGLDGARGIFGDDSVYPIRGQVVRVVAPWIKNYYNIDGSNYVIPNIDTVVLGGTSQHTHGDRDPDPADRQAILNNVCAHLPSLRGAEIVQEWVGYRPGRPSVRLELVEEQFEKGDSEARVPVVHNYGHGGAGITLSWGCALDTLELVRQALA